LPVDMIVHHKNSLTGFTVIKKQQIVPYVCALRWISYLNLDDCDRSLHMDVKFLWSSVGSQYIRFILEKDVKLCIHFQLLLSRAQRARENGWIISTWRYASYRSIYHITVC